MHRARARAILDRFAGHPEVPNGIPSGVLAYVVTAARPAHGIGPEGAAERLGEDRPRLYYAALETDPFGLPMLTYPRGTQDLLVRRPDGQRDQVELGQRRTLLAELGRVWPERRRRWTAEPEAGHTWASELNRLHLDVVEGLLATGAEVRVEEMLETAIRETREEHGFDLDAERDRLVRLDRFVESAPSKRRRGAPIDHWIYAAWMADFDGVTPRQSTIEEQKNPQRLGRRYVERGTFATLAAMDARLRSLRGQVDGTALGGDPLVCLGLAVCAGRLAMLARIERALVERIRALGIEVHSKVDPALAPAPVRQMLTFHPERLPATNR